MTMAPLTLPEGRRGQILAVAIAIAAAVLLWLCTAAPLLGWYDARAARLAQQERIAARMKALSQDIPALRHAVSAAGLQAHGSQVLLAGNTDVIAGANLQSLLQTLAANAGTSLDSAALLPTKQAGTLRRISVQVSVTTTWPVLIALLEAIGTSRPCMIVNQINLTDSMQMEPDNQIPVAANFTVTSFRAATP